MPLTRRAVLLACLAASACERADPPPPAPPPPPPAAPAPMPAPAMARVQPAPLPKPRAWPRQGILAGFATRREAKHWFGALDHAKQPAVTALCRYEQSDPCRSLSMASLGPPPKEVMDPVVAALTSDELDQVDSYCGTVMPSSGHCNTPLVVAFDGAPIETTAGAAPFAFVPGAPVASDWPTARTPWIALDRDGDGAITSGAELFGDATLLPDGRPATNGFEALAVLDDNHDGQLDARDRAFASLLLWTDRDGDRRSSSGELAPLASSVIAIPLAYTRDPRCNAAGDCEGERGAIRWRAADGERTGAVVDLYLPSR